MNCTDPKLPALIDCSNNLQQQDGYNCGVFAMQNAQKIISGVKEKLSDAGIKSRVQSYNPTQSQLQDLRRNFALSVSGQEIFGKEF